MGRPDMPRFSYTLRVARSLNPAHLDLASLARGHRQVLGSDSARSYPRLVSELEGVPDLTKIHWIAQGEQRTDAAGKPVPWLHLEIQTELPLRCQRCLEPVAVNLNLNRAFRFVDDEATAEREDEESEEDVLVFEPLLNLHALVEDEVLMALPMIPLHEACLPAGAPTHDPVVSKDEPLRNPFAALERLRRRREVGE